MKESYNKSISISSFIKNFHRKVKTTTLRIFYNSFNATYERVSKAKNLKLRNYSSNKNLFWKKTEFFPKIRDV